VWDGSRRDMLDRFRETYEDFARSYCRPPLVWKDFERLMDARQFDLSCGSVAGVDLVYHTHVVVGSRARLLDSISQPSARADPTSRKLVARTNCMLHWNDMLRFKARGLRTYDFGGWYEGTSDVKKLRINAFKKSFGGRVEQNYQAERLVTVRAHVGVAIAKLVGRRK
jgi:hypothetical protein